jgi:hypothetical protein
VLVVVVQEDPTAEIDTPTSTPGRGDECRIASETPFGADLRPVAAPFDDRGVDIPIARNVQAR